MGRKRLSKAVAQNLAQPEQSSHRWNFINDTAQDPEPKRLCAQVFRLSSDIAQNWLSKVVAQNLAQDIQVTL